MRSKIKNFGNRFLCLSWRDNDIKVIYFKWFHDTDKLIEWMEENKSKSFMDSIRIKKSGLFSVKYGWKLIRYTNGRVEVDNT